MESLKVGDKVKTVNPLVSDLLDERETNIFTIMYFMDNNKRAYLKGVKGKSWLIEEVVYLKECNNELQNIKKLK